MIRAVTAFGSAKKEPPSVPSWAIQRGSVASDAEAAFLAGAALNSLDTLVRADSVWAGAWRQRLALRCAAASVRLIGRSEDEGALRDAALLTRPGDDVGPAGNIFAAWRRLASRSPAVDVACLRGIVELLGLSWSDDLDAVPAQLDAFVRSSTPAPFVAAAIAAQIHSMRPDAQLLGWWLADLVLAQKLRWPTPVPLLMAQIFATIFRSTAVRGAGTRIRPGEEQFERAVCLAVAQGAVEACGLAGDIARRADRLAAAVPKLRAKGAGEAIEKLLANDAVVGFLVTKNLSRFASRRLFERLIEFDAVRELSGRPTFRLYGL